MDVWRVTSSVECPCELGTCTQIQTLFSALCFPFLVIHFLKKNLSTLVQLLLRFLVKVFLLKPKLCSPNGFSTHSVLSPADINIQCES